MSIHTIHGIKVDFHSDTEGAKDFLVNGVHSETAKDYLARAKNEGESYILDTRGHLFKIIYKEGEEGEDDIFSVEKSYHSF
jgi:hypothetical protein